MKTSSTPRRKALASNGSLPVTPRKSPARDWYAALGRLFRPLTPDQCEAIRHAFGQHRQKDAQRLLDDWPRISEVAHQHALSTHWRATDNRLKPRVRRKRDGQLREASAAAADAIRAIETVVTVWSRHLLHMDSQTRLAQWGTGLIASLTDQRRAIERYRSQASEWPEVAGKDGPPTSVGTLLLEVLAAYGRHHRWPVSAASRGLFAKLAEGIINRGNPTSAPRLRAVVASSHDYARLDADSPRFSPADKRLHLAAASRRPKAPM